MYAAMSTMPSDDARRYPRVAIGLPAVQIAGAEFADLRIVLIDLGQGGVLIKAEHRGDGEPPRPPPIGARATLTFLMIGKRLCQADGRVVRHQGHGFAIAFDDINEAMQSFTYHLAKLPPALRVLYVADILRPTLTLGA